MYSDQCTCTVPPFLHAKRTLGTAVESIGTPNVHSATRRSSKSQKYFRGTAVKFGSLRRRIIIAVAVVSAGTPNEKRQYHFSNSRSVNLPPRTTTSHMLKPMHDARRFVAKGMYCSEMAEMVHATVPRTGSMLWSGYMKRKMDSAKQLMTERIQKTRRRWLMCLWMQWPRRKR